MKKVLYISYDGMTDPLGQSQVIPYLQGLAKCGHVIHLLSCEKKDNFSSFEGLIQKLLTENGIVWHPIIYTKTPPVLSTFWDVTAMTRKAKKLHRQHSFDIVHCRSYIAAIVGCTLKKRHDLKFVFDIRGFWADERVDGNIWNTKNIIFNVIYKYFKKKEAVFFAQADAIVTLTNVSKNYILKHYSTSENISVIPCAADLGHFVPQTSEVRKEYRAKIGVENDFVLLYLGSIGTWYLLDEMLDFFMILQKTHASAKFLFITGDSDFFIKRSALKKGISETQLIIKKSTREDVPRWVSTADMSVFFIKDCFSKMASSPTKHGELLGVNVPVVCNDIGDLREIIKFKNSGVIVNELNEESYESAINKVRAASDFLDAKATALEFYSLEKGIEKYNSVYQSLA